MDLYSAPSLKKPVMRTVDRSPHVLTSGRLSPLLLDAGDDFDLVFEYSAVILL